MFCVFMTSFPVPETICSDLQVYYTFWYFKRAESFNQTFIFIVFRSEQFKHDWTSLFSSRPKETVSPPDQSLRWWSSSRAETGKTGNRRKTRKPQPKVNFYRGKMSSFINALMMFVSRASSLPVLQSSGGSSSVPQAVGCLGMFILIQWVFWKSLF